MFWLNHLQRFPSIPVGVIDEESDTQGVHGMCFHTYYCNLNIFIVRSNVLLPIRKSVPNQFVVQI